MVKVQSVRVAVGLPCSLGRQCGKNEMKDNLQKSIAQYVEEGIQCFRAQRRSRAPQVCVRNKKTVETCDIDMEESEPGPYHQ